MNKAEQNARDKKELMSPENLKWLFFMASRYVHEHKLGFDDIALKETSRILTLLDRLTDDGHCKS